MADHFYTCCEDGMLSQVPPTDRSGLCPACKPRTPAQPLLTDDDWQAIADEADRIVPGKLIAVIQKRIALALARGVPVPAPERQAGVAAFFGLVPYPDRKTDVEIQTSKNPDGVKGLPNA